MLFIRHIGSSFNYYLIVRFNGSREQKFFSLEKEMQIHIFFHAMAMDRTRKIMCLNFKIQRESDI